MSTWLHPFLAILRLCPTIPPPSLSQQLFSSLYWTSPISKKHAVTDFNLLDHTLAFGAAHDLLFLVHFPPTSLAISSQCPLLDHSSSSQSLKVVNFRAQFSTSVSPNIHMGYSYIPFSSTALNSMCMLKTLSFYLQLQTHETNTYTCNLPILLGYW